MTKVTKTTAWGETCLCVLTIKFYKNTDKIIEKWHLVSKFCSEYSKEKWEKLTKGWLDENRI